jgi:hypothetical protein
MSNRNVCSKVWLTLYRLANQSDALRLRLLSYQANERENNITTLRIFSFSKASNFKFQLSNGLPNTIFILYVLLKKFGFCSPISIFAAYSSQV